MVRTTSTLMDEDKTKTSEEVDSAWKETVTKALQVWESLEYPRKEDHYHESLECPMHPNLFFQLSSISGFNKRNGQTYEECVVKWSN